MMEFSPATMPLKTIPQAFAQNADLVKSSDADIEQQAKCSTPFYGIVHDVLAAFLLPHAAPEMQVFIWCRS